MRVPPALLLFLLSLALLTTPAAGQVFLGYCYKDAGYSGTTLPVYSNTAISNLGSTSIGNDAITSCDLSYAEGYLVTFYMDSSYAGTPMTVRTPFTIDSLVAQGWNDKASSMLVLAVLANTPGITLYDGASMTGKFQYFGANAWSQNYASLSPFPASSISSMIVYGNSKAWIFGSTGGNTACPDLSCAIASVSCTLGVTSCTPNFIYAILPNNIGSSLYLQWLPSPTTQPPTYLTTTSVASTTASVASTTQAVTTTTQATVTTSNAATVYLSTFTTRAGCTFHCLGGPIFPHVSDGSGSGGSAPGPIILGGPALAQIKEADQEAAKISTTSTTSGQAHTVSTGTGRAPSRGNVQGGSTTGQAPEAPQEQPEQPVPVVLYLRRSPLSHFERAQPADVPRLDSAHRDAPNAPSAH